jgi:hypothetical protein
VARKFHIVLFLFATRCFAANYSKFPLAFEKYDGKFISRAAEFNLLVGNQEMILAMNGRKPAIVRMILAGANQSASVT